MRTEGGSPNLINGVSRQPHEVRLVSQLEESENQFPTISRGLVPRNPTLLRGVLPSANPANSTVHLIDRDEQEKYVVTVSPHGVEVFDLEGNPQTVDAPNGYGYLGGALSGDLEALTVADHTFIVNRRKTVQTSTELTPAYVNGGLVHIVQGDYHTDYKILVDGVEVAKYTTEGGPFSNEEQARSAERGARTSVIAHQLFNGTAPAGMTTLPATAPTNLSSVLTGPDWVHQLLDNVIFISRPDGTPFSLEAEAGSETRARAHKQVSQDFSELPRKAPDGFTLRVSGSDDTNYDDYYVRFDHPATAAQGRWKETVGPSLRFKLDAATMPHILVRQTDGTFVFKQAEWANREVGDLETNPWPSFVDHTIDGMVFYKNRVGFVSGEAVAMSRHGDFFNFFIESIITPLDTDPVDVAISYPEVSDIRYAVPFSGELVMFTSSVPFRLASGELFTPKSANFEHLMSNRASSRVRPVVAGSYLYFVNDVPSGCFVHEFIYDREIGVKDAPTITDHVNGYIPSGVHLMEADEDLKILVLVSEGDPSAVYVYKWLWVGQDKAQSAWQRWSVGAPIIGMRFFGEELVLVTNHDAHRRVSAINCHEAWSGGSLPHPIFLDHQRVVQGVYNAEGDKTAFHLPVASEGASVVLCGEDEFGQQLEPEQYVGNAVVVSGDHAKAAAVGWEYESYGVFSKFLHRKTNNQGGYSNATPGMNTTIANVTLDTAGTAYLGVDVLRDYRKSYSYNFSAALVGTKTGTVGKLVVGEVKKPVSVMARSEDFTLRFGNRGPFPYSVMSYQWSGQAYPISY